MRYSYKQISVITDKKVSNIRALVHKLGIKKYVVRGVTKIDKEGLSILEAHYAPKISKINNKYKLRVLENYFICESYRETSKICGIGRQTVKKIVEEWEETGCIVIDSCINFPEKIQNKGIFYRGYNWGYSFMHKGKRYYKRGFEQELQAVEELYKLKEELRLNE